MTKKERKRLLIGTLIMALVFFSVAMIGWTQKEFVINYFYGFDGKYETVIVKKGYQKNPLEPGRYGHVFDGWYYLDKQGNEVLFDFESERVTRNLDLTAHWKPFETEFIFDPTGGDCDVESMLVPYGSEFVLPTPEKKGWYFVGWGGDTGWLFPQEELWEQPFVDVRLKARWSKFRPGTVYVLGEYEQTAIYDNEVFVGWQRDPIEWIPVDKIDGKYLLVAKDSLDYRRFDSGYKSVPWADCDLREWLNGEFYNNTFTDEEKAVICDFTDTELGTTDKVFLLSLEESKMIFGLESYVSGTDYARTKGLEDPRNCDETTTWFGERYVFYPWYTRTLWDGLVYTAHGGGGISRSGIRPAILIDPSKLKAR